MPDTEFQVESLGEVYAQALINEAQKQGVLDQVTDDIQGIGQVLRENAGFRAFAEALDLGEEERLASLKRIFEGRVHPLTLNVLLAMARRDRLMFLRGLVEGFDDILRKMGGRIDVEVTSSQPLRPELLQRLQDAISRSQAKTADIKLTINPALIGGVTVRIDDTLVDGSIATQLQKIKDQIKRGGTVKAERVVAP
jgi:F-type H+-transporting ATPase subunit delta